MVDEVLTRRAARLISKACRPAALNLNTPAKLAARMRSWRVSLLRGRAQYLGEVEAPDERAAEAAAVARFELNDDQRKRVAVQEVDAS